MNTISRFVAGMLVLLGCALLAACASGPSIHTQSNPSVNVASYRTFGFFSPLATDKDGYESMLSARLKAATRQALEAKGYVYDESSPDLRINFFANIEDRQDIRTYQTAPPMGGYYGYRTGFYSGFNTTEVETVNYKAGTLTIDLVDPERKVVAWQGQAEGRVSSKARKNPGPAIDAVVAEILAPLPAHMSR